MAKATKTNKLVGNFTSLFEKNALKVRRETILDPKLHIDPELTTAILRRNVAGIRELLNPQKGKDKK